MPRVFFPTRLGSRTKFNFSVLRIFLFPSMILWEDGMRNRDGGGALASQKYKKDPAMVFMPRSCPLRVTQTGGGGGRNNFWKCGNLIRTALCMRGKEGGKCNGG